MMRSIYKLLLLLPAVCGGWGWVDLRTPSYVQIWVSDIEKRVTWKEAQTICRQNYTDLATIRTPQENQMINSNGGWLGLYRNISNPEWRWSRGDEVANFTSWNTEKGEPKNRGCAVKRWNAETWFTSYCDYKRHFICSEERLVLVKEKKTWEEALEHCRALEAAEPEQGYELATLWTPDDLAFAREKAEGATTAEVWTGLRHLAGHWLWLAGKQVLNQTLPDCPAQASCGALLVAGSQQPIHASDCQLRNNFLCSKKYQHRRITI